jgi:hypothetical protein
MEVMPNGLERLDSNETISFGDVAGAENYPKIYSSTSKVAVSHRPMSWEIFLLRMKFLEIM